MKDYMGIYEIEYITNKKLTIAILPKKINKELIWDLKDGEGWFSSIDIKNAIDFGYKIKRIKQGYYWTEKAPIFKDYIKSMIRKKQSTDKTLYPSKYTMYKTAMNAIYGKQLQKDILQKTTIIEKISDLLILMKTNDCLISEFNYGNKILVEYEPHYIETLISKRPVEIGIFILSYSRLEMLKEFKKYDTIESMPYYTDTDSIYIESKYLDKSNLPYMFHPFYQVIVDYFKKNYKNIINKMNTKQSSQYHISIYNNMSANADYESLNTKLTNIYNNLKIDLK
jgi:hypothetical protein